MEYFKKLQCYKPKKAIIDSPISIEEVALLQNSVDKDILGRIRGVFYGSGPERTYEQHPVSGLAGRSAAQRLPRGPQPEGVYRLLSGRVPGGRDAAAALRRLRPRLRTGGCPPHDRRRRSPGILRQNALRGLTAGACSLGKP